MKQKIESDSRRKETTPLLRVREILTFLSVPPSAVAWCGGGVVVWCRVAVWCGAVVVWCSAVVLCGAVVWCGGVLLCGGVDAVVAP